jgi:hypothetical protein
MQVRGEPDDDMDDIIGALERRLGHRWPALLAARTQARLVAERISGLVRDLSSEDAAMVVYGSLARGEWTDRSDVDWTLLIDGRADPDHVRVAREISRRLDEGRFNRPGPTGVFGNMTFSHDLFNKIGGVEDTNENTTQRILLLLESRALGRPEAHERLLSLIVSRYLEDDRGLLFGSQPHKVPRYLINDIVRYWRTIAVDFVDKQRVRPGRGWALRNAKLRLSRKLIFVSGLLLCFGCELWSPAEARAALSGDRRTVAPLGAHLLRFIRRTPLEILAHALLHSAVRPETAAALFSAYDAFIAILSDEERRTHLMELTQDRLSGDPLFIEVCRVGRRFQEALTRMFFREDDRLAELTVTYGVF